MKNSSPNPPVSIRVKLDANNADFIFPADVRAKDVKVATAGIHRILTRQKKHQEQGYFLYVFRAGHWVSEPTEYRRGLFSGS